MIDQAEQFLRAAGFSELRVRYHRGDLARVEVAARDLPRLVEVPFREKLLERLRQLGFKYVTVDLSGFRSGSLNAVLAAGNQLVALSPLSRPDEEASSHAASNRPEPAR
jgi:pyridinium-3,5-biscarboxylic acid mononucleotide sulfurtransferase